MTNLGDDSDGAPRRQSRTKFIESSLWCPHAGRTQDEVRRDQLDSRSEGVYPRSEGASHLMPFMTDDVNGGGSHSRLSSHRQKCTRAVCKWRIEGKHSPTPYPARRACAARAHAGGDRGYAFAD